MKRIFLVLTICLTTLISNSDIAIDFVNNAGYEASLTGEYTFQLLHNDSGMTGYMGYGNLLGTGDTLLTSITTTEGYAGTFSSQGVGIYSTPNYGVVYIRVYQTGDYGNLLSGPLPTWVVASSAFTEYDSLNPATIYSTDGIIPSGWVYSVVPEPSTVLLISTSTLALIAYRRKDKIFSKFDAVDLINYKPESTISTKWKYR